MAKQCSVAVTDEDRLRMIDWLC